MVEISIVGFSADPGRRAWPQPHSVPLGSSNGILIGHGQRLRGHHTYVPQIIDNDWLYMTILYYSKLLWWYNDIYKLYIYDNTYIYFVIYIMSPYWTFIIEPIWNLYESIWVYARRVLASSPMILEQFEGTLQLHRLDTIKARWQELDLQRLISILRVCLKMDWCCCHFHTIFAPFCSCLWSCQKSMLGHGLYIIVRSFACLPNASFCNI